MRSSAYFVASPSRLDVQALLGVLLEHLPLGISLVDHELHVVLVNRALMDLLDFPPALFEPPGQMPTLEQLTLFNARRGEYGPGDPQVQTAERMALARQGLAHRFIRTRPNGRVLQVIGVPLPDGGFVSIYSDITEQQQVQESLRQQALYLRSVLNHLPQGISVFDDQLRLKCWNGVLQEVLELPASALVADASFEDLLMYPARRGEYGPGDPAELVAQRRQRALCFEPHRFERTRPNGRTHLVEGRPMQAEGRVVGFVTSYTDITEARERERALQLKTALLQTLVDNMPDGVTIFDEQLRLVLINQCALQLLDFPPERVKGQADFAELARWNAQRGEYGEVDVEQVVAEMVERARHPVAHRLERTRPNGTVIELRGAPLPHGGFVTIYTDITERKNVERQLRHQSEVFQTLVDNIPGGVTLFGPDLRLLASNQEFARLLDFPSALFEGVPSFERFIRFNAERGEYGDCETEAKVREMMALVQRREPHHFVRTRPNGLILEVRGLPLATGGFVTIYTDVTEKHRAAQAIERLAHRDVLTGLANRYSLEAHLDELVEQARRHGRHFVVMFLDMDNFKGINDTLGHAVGDEFLCVIAQRLQGCVRERDVVARLGGDEFVVVLSDMGDVRAASLVAAKIAQAVEQPLELAGQQLRSSVSIGICCFPQDGDSRGALMQRADIAMYHAKRAGMGRFHYFDASMMSRASERMQAERALREAVERGEFELYYQPLLNADGVSARGVEALMRWRRSDGSMVSPAEFIPLAEELGLIDTMGEWALRRACTVMAAWQREGLEGLSMAVNLSAVQLRDAGLPRRIARALRDSGLMGRFLTLEVTESVAMQDPQASVQRLGLIRALGVHVAMDDFGTGYSSLAYLKRLPLDYLKLDKTFVMDLERDSNDAAICSATIGLAHALGLAVVAEGVETAAQRDFLVQQGCDALQGFWFTRPLPEEDARQWLLQHREGFVLPGETAQSYDAVI